MRIYHSLGIYFRVLQGNLKKHFLNLKRLRINHTILLTLEKVMKSIALQYFHCKLRANTPTTLNVVIMS